MCGRFTLRSSPKLVAEIFELPTLPLFEARYNIAPTQMVGAIRLNDERHYDQLRWGLVPSWAKDLSFGAKTINARSETITEKPAFRNAFQRRRCLIVADGFYEWQKTGKTKQPMYILMKDERPFAFAGLWERWRGDNELVESCTILTTTANSLLNKLHDRMPVILSSEDYNSWLDPECDPQRTLVPLLRPFPDEKMKMYPVSSQVNNARHETADCVEPLNVQNEFGF
ncbi:MAG: SOS response-associated peptidase [Planctomycetota bacterium]